VAQQARIAAHSPLQMATTSLTRVTHVSETTLPSRINDTELAAQQQGGNGLPTVQVFNADDAVSPQLSNEQVQCCVM
jgi:hypothetical protein